MEEFIDLDVAVLNALELYSKSGLPDLNLGDYKRTLVVGSGNAAITGRILFVDKDSVLSDESTYGAKLKAIPEIDGALLISASGEKHAPVIAKDLREKGIEVRHLTCNPNPSSKQFIDKDKFFVCPKVPEPYTYNTSTYLGMILAKTKENPKEILKFIKEKIDPLITDLKNYDAYFFIFPEKFEEIGKMFLRKFDELFGANISARAATMEQTKHGMTVVPYEREMFVSIGVENKDFGENRLDLPLPKNADYGVIMAIGYYFIGQVQKQNIPWFKEHIKEYTEKMSEKFNANLKPIVE